MNPPEAGGGGGGHNCPHGSSWAPQGLGSGFTGPRPLPDPTPLNSFCKGRTLHSFVRDPKTSLDINKTRQIAQEIIKVKGHPPALVCLCQGGGGCFVSPLCLDASRMGPHLLPSLHVSSNWSRKLDTRSAMMEWNWSGWSAQL